MDDDFKLLRPLDHGHGTIGRGVAYSTVEKMLKHRYEAGARFWVGLREAKERLAATPCKRLMLQQQPFGECFPLENCAGCDCWRRTLIQDRVDEMFGRLPTGDIK